MGHLLQEYHSGVLSAAFTIGVLGNLVAAVICGVPAFLHVVHKMDKQHDERMQQAERQHQHVMNALSSNQQGKAD